MYWPCHWICVSTTRSGSIEKITEASTFTYAEPRILFSARNYRTGIYRREYAVAPDDQRFIFVRRLNETRPDQLVVIEQVTAMEPR